VWGESRLGCTRIHGELLKLGIDLGESSVSKYMVRRRKPLSQTWRTYGRDNNCEKPFPLTNPALNAPRSRRHFRPSLPQRGNRHGNLGSAVEPAIPLAACLRRAGDWFDSAGEPGPCDRVSREVATSYPSFVFGLLSSIENASPIRQGLA
jgi:hypothetical protein